MYTNMVTRKTESRIQTGYEKKKIQGNMKNPVPERRADVDRVSAIGVMS